MTQKEARLLHFSRSDKNPTDLSFNLSHPTSKGFPIDIPLQGTYTETKILSEQYESGLMEAITEIVGEGGIMDGWFVSIPPLVNHLVSNITGIDRRVYAIGKCHKNWDGGKNVNVIVVRETVEGENWSPTPCSSLADEVLGGGA